MTIDVTQQLMGKNGNAGDYYKSLPKGNAMFVTAKKKTTHIKHVPRWYEGKSFEELDEFRREVILACNDAGGVGKFAYKIDINKNVVSFCRSSHWEKVSNNHYKIIRDYLDCV